MDLDAIYALMGSLVCPNCQGTGYTTQYDDGTCDDEYEHNCEAPCPRCNGAGCFPSKDLLDEVHNLVMHVAELREYLGMYHNETLFQYKHRKIEEERNE